jgi:hypothetical protein
VHEIQPFTLAAKLTEDEAPELPAVASSDTRKRLFPAYSPKARNRENAVENKQ